jgi:hypothetical protein
MDVTRGGDDADEVPEDATDPAALEFMCVMMRACLCAAYGVAHPS